MLVRLRLIFNSIEYDLHTDAIQSELGNWDISIELIQHQILSLLDILIKDQILISMVDATLLAGIDGTAITCESTHDLTLQECLRCTHDNIDTIRLLLIEKKTEKCDTINWNKTCTKSIFGSLPAVQPVYKREDINGTNAKALLCQVCAQACRGGQILIQYAFCILIVAIACKPLDQVEWFAYAQDNAADVVSYISSVILVQGYKAPDGFEMLPWDLNYANSGPSVHLCIQRGGPRAVHAIDLCILENCASPQTSFLERFTLNVHTIHRNDPEFMDLFAISEIIVLYGHESHPPNGYIKAVTAISKTEMYLCYALAPLNGFCCQQSEISEGTKSSPKDMNVERWFAYIGLSNKRRKADLERKETRYRQKESEMRNRLVSGLKRVQRYEDPSMQQQARDHMPLEFLKKQALEKTRESGASRSYGDELIIQLLHWFKTEFFTWVNQPKCSSCGSEKTEYKRTDGPQNAEEIEGDASRVEVYQCENCEQLTKFPRYNNPAKLLSSRRGRCGEWANCFSLCCRALNYDTRFVHDVTDHVWTEIYSTSQDRWIHCDPCEDLMDAPLTYEVGWNKKLSYIFAFSIDGIVDVARRYTQDFGAMLSRRVDVSEEWLHRELLELNQNRQRIQSNPQAIEWMRRLAKEQEQLESISRPVSHSELQGRISGSIAWKSARQEVRNIHPVSVDPESEISLVAADQNAAQTLCHNLLKGCGNEDCPNRYCLHQQMKMAQKGSVVCGDVARRLIKSCQLEKTEHVVCVLQGVSDLSRILSEQGLLSLLCPLRSDLRCEILKFDPVLYLPLQDDFNPGKALVDISGLERHLSLQTTYPLRKTMPVSSSNLCICGIALLPRQRLEIPLHKSDAELRMAFSVLLAFRHIDHTPDSIRVGPFFSISIRGKTGVLAAVEFAIADLACNSVSVLLKKGAQRCKSKDCRMLDVSTHFGILATPFSITVYVNGSCFAVSQHEAVDDLASATTISLVGSSYQTPLIVTTASHLAIFDSNNISEDIFRTLDRRLHH